MKAGLFPEDAKEATDISENQTQPVIPHTIWFDSMSGRLVIPDEFLIRRREGFVLNIDWERLFRM